MSDTDGIRLLPEDWEGIYIEDLGDDAQVAEAVRLAKAAALLREAGFVPVDPSDRNGPWVPAEEVSS